MLWSAILSPVRSNIEIYKQVRGLHAPQQPFCLDRHLSPGMFLPIPATQSKVLLPSALSAPSSGAHLGRTALCGQKAWPFPEHLALLYRILCLTSPSTAQLVWAGLVC
jgi:hypothetical protein